MKILNYAIIEDEAILRHELQLLMAQLRPSSVLAFEADSVEEALHSLSKHSDLDLIFMDIELTDGNCFEIFEHTSINCPVIFTTAYEEYALKAFSVLSIDYLLKPITSINLEASIDKYEHLTTLHSMPSSNLMTQLATLMDRSRTPSRVLIECGDSFSHVNIDEIAYFISDNGLIFAHLHNGTRKLTRFTSLSELTGTLNSNDFFKLTRGLVASIKSIKSVKKYFKSRLKVVVTDSVNTKDCIVTADRRREFLNWMGQ